MLRIYVTEIFTYDGMAVLNPFMSENDFDELDNTFSMYSQIDSYMYAFQDEIHLYHDNEEINVNIIVPNEVSELDNYFTLVNRKTNDELLLSNEGIIINEKLANLLALDVNHYLQFDNSLGNKANLKITGITENYTYHFIYISPELYKQSVNDYRNNVAYMKFQNNDFYEDILKEKNILSLVLSEDNKEIFQESSRNLTSIVVLIIIAAALLAFVVLYNLANINITERNKELLTFKVLGMTDTELTLYIARESIFSTVIGIGIGLLVGVFFLDYVIKVIEYKDIMFLQEINALSYILTTILTIVFSSIVSFIFHWKLRALDMVEAMKSAE